VFWTAEHDVTGTSHPIRKIKPGPGVVMSGSIGTFGDDLGTHSAAV